MTALYWQEFQQQQQQKELFVKHCMVEGRDFGSVIGDRPALLKPGAELLVQWFGFEVETRLDEKIMDWSGKAYKGEPLFYFRYHCKMSLGGKVVADGFGSANSWEPKHRYRWVKELPDGVDPALVTKREGVEEIFEWQYKKGVTKGKYGRPQSYYDHVDELLAQDKVKKVMKEQPWNKEEALCYQFPLVEYRIPNPEIGDLINTLEKMADKRAFVAAALKASATSGFFTQDLEDMMGLGDIKEWLPHFTEFYHTVAPGIPNLLKGAETEADRINVVRSLFKDKFQIDAWDAALATQAQAYMLGLNKEKVNVDEAMEPEEGYGWLVHLAKEAGSKIDFSALTPSAGASAEEWRHAFHLLVKHLEAEGVEVTPPPLLPQSLKNELEEDISEFARRSRIAEVDVEDELREPDGGY